MPVFLHQSLLSYSLFVLYIWAWVRGRNSNNLFIFINHPFLNTNTNIKCSPTIQSNSFSNTRPMLICWAKIFFQASNDLSSSFLFFSSKCFVHLLGFVKILCMYLLTTLKSYHIKYQFSCLSFLVECRLNMTSLLNNYLMKLYSTNCGCINTNHSQTQIYTKMCLTTRRTTLVLLKLHQIICYGNCVHHSNYFEISIFHIEIQTDKQTIWKLIWTHFLRSAVISILFFIFSSLYFL